MVEKIRKFLQREVAEICVEACRSRFVSIYTVFDVSV